MIALGFLLTLTGTTIALIPPYLTMHLVDQVLIPHQNGQHADFGRVPWFLAGLLGAAALAWIFDAVRLFVLAWTSERVSADLRHPHLRPHAPAVGRFLRRQTHRRPHVTHQQRHRTTLQLPVAQPGGLRLRRADDRHDRRGAAEHRPRAGAGGPVSLSAHRLARVPGARPVAARLPWRRRRLGGHDQHAGRHRPGHPRRQGVRPGNARDQTLRRRQRARGQRQQPPQSHLGLVWPHGYLADHVRFAHRLGLRLLAGGAAW